MNKRDQKALRRLLDTYDAREIASEMGTYYWVAALERGQRGDVVGQRWNERAAKSVPLAVKGALAKIDGRIESQPELDDLLGVE